MKKNFNPINLRKKQGKAKTQTLKKNILINPNKMKKAIWLYTFILLLMLTCIFANAQDNVTNNDFGTWTSIIYKYEHNRQWALQTEGQLRTKSNLKDFDRFITEFELHYDPDALNWLKPLKFTLAGRYIGKNDNIGGQQGFENWFRYQVGASYKVDLGRFSTVYRLRYQKRNQLGVSELEGVYPSQDWRHKFSIEYDIKNWKLDPKFSYEFFIHNETGDINGFTKYRIRLDTDKKVKSGQQFSMFCMIEGETLEENPQTNYILGLKYRFSTKRDKKENEE